MLREDDIRRILKMGESLEREFKSDRNRISDQIIYEEIMAMANSLGGVLLIGVEDDGTISGAQPRHGQFTDSLKIQSAIFNNTVPHINTRVSVVPMENKPILAIEVDPYPEICATASGKSLRRIIGGDGKPQTVPFYPSNHRSRRIDLGLLDFSAHPLPELSIEGFDPLEFERLRQSITRLHGDRNLLD